MVVLLVEHLCVCPYGGFISRTSLCRSPMVVLLVEHLCVSSLWWFY